jgi:hypothetical protein
MNWNNNFGFFLLFFNFISNNCNEILKVSKSMSTKSIFAPQYKAQLEVATKLTGDVQTKSFLLRPKDKQPRCKAEVALLTTNEYLDPQNKFIFFSNSSIFGPVVK